MIENILYSLFGLFIITISIFLYFYNNRHEKKLLKDDSIFNLKEKQTKEKNYIRLMILLIGKFMKKI